MVRSRLVSSPASGEAGREGDPETHQTSWIPFPSLRDAGDDTEVPVRLTFSLKAKLALTIPECRLILGDLARAG